MRIMHVEAGRNLYGGALQVLYLVRFLQSQYIENILVCPEASAIGEAACEFAEIEECKMDGDLDFGFRSRLSRLIQKHKPDLVHVHSRRGADFWGGLAAKREGVPAILTRRVDNREPAFLARYKARIYRQVVAISEGIRSVQLSLGLHPEQVVTIRSAVDTEKFDSASGSIGIHQRFKLEPNSMVVAVIAQLIERKGHSYLFKAIPEILGTFPHVHFLILGQGALLKELKQQVRAHKIEESVSFVGFQEDIESILPAIDLVVHPALAEGLGVSLLQASACRVPIVASAVGGIPEIVRDGINGLLVPPANSAELCNKICQLLGNRETRLKYGVQGRELVEKEFSIVEMGRQNLELYKSVLS